MTYTVSSGTLNSSISYHHVAACTVWTIVFGALESVAVLWHLRSHRDIIISIIHVTGNEMAFSMEGEKLAVSVGT